MSPTLTQFHKKDHPSIYKKTSFHFVCIGVLSIQLLFETACAKMHKVFNQRGISQPSKRQQQDVKVTRKRSMKEKVEVKSAENVFLCDFLWHCIFEISFQIICDHAHLIVL